MDALLRRKDVHFYETIKGYTAMHCMSSGHEDVVNVLLQRELKYQSSRCGCTPLYVGCQNGHIDIVNALISRDGIDINKGDESMDSHHCMLRALRVTWLLSIHC